MTEKKKPARTRAGLCGMIFPIVAAVMLAVVQKNAETAAKSVYHGLLLCARTVIPSLFPFMVISDILCKAGLDGICERIFKKPMRALFGISGSGASALFLGALCGFPIGAKTAVSLLDSGRITRSECEALLTFSNNPSSAFLVGAVGVSMLGNKTAGVVLYAVTLFWSVAVGALFSRIKRKDERKEPCLVPPLKKKTLGVTELTEAISSSALGVIRICGFVVFFSALLGVISPALDGLGVHGEVKAVVFSLLEMTGGSAAAAELADARLSLAVAAFAAGWSGLSVHFQIMSICAGRSLSFARYFASKLCQGVLSALTLFFLASRPQGKLALFPSRESVGLSLSDNNRLFSVILIIFALALVLAIAKKTIPWYNKKDKTEERRK